LKKRAVIALWVVMLVAAVPSAASPGLIHWWKADGDATDSVAGNNGILIGDTTFGAGHSGQAFSFDGNGDAVAVQPPNPDDHLFSGSFTVEAWVKTTSTAPLQEIVAKYECGNLCPANNAYSDYEIWLTNGVPTGYVRDTDAGGPDPDGGQSIALSNSVADGAWHHLTLKRDIANGFLCLSADAETVSHGLTAGASGPLTSTDGEDDPLMIGAYIVGGGSTLTGFLDGLVDDVQLTDAGTCPTPTAVQIVSFTARQTPAGTVLSWRTASEASFAGFNVYRSGARVNRALVAAHGVGLGGGSYRLLDRGAHRGARYWLQAIRLDGTRAWLKEAATR
jgi:hypothetical protein